jgi:hypothetical protein
MEEQQSPEGGFVKLTQQPKCMINGKLEPHQIDSLNWMASLYDLKLNGILADDMVRPRFYLHLYFALRDLVKLSNLWRSSPMSTSLRRLGVLT